MRLWKITLGLVIIGFVGMSAQDAQKPEQSAGQLIQIPQGTAALEKQIKDQQAQIAELLKRVPAKGADDQVKELTASFKNIIKTARDTVDARACVAADMEYWVTVQANGISYACMKKLTK